MNTTQTNIPPAGRLLLLGSVFAIAACGLVYELVAGAVSSYLLGDAITQFSLVIGVFLCAMGVGSFIAKFITQRLLRTFIEVQIWIGLVGGCSSMLMFAVSAFLNEIFPVFFYSLCALIGILIGIEIPLLVRILQESQAFSEALSHVLALDYVGALAGSILFPFVVLPYLGLSRASVVFGLLNLTVAGVGIELLREPRRWGMTLRLAIAVCLLFTALFFSTQLVGFLEDLLYQDDIMYAKTTPYQRIVLTRWRDDVRLYLNGSIQFSSFDEARYHESLVIPAMEAAGRPTHVAILGGGDGLAAREILKYNSVERIVLVDIDPTITDISSTRPELVAMNQGALSSPKVTVLNTDAMRFIETTQEFFDVIIIDLPDPNNETLSKLYSTSFYALCARRLRPTGVLVTQATSPFYAPAAFWCIAHTIDAAVSGAPDIPGLIAAPYHVNVPSFGEWGFVLAGKRPLDPTRLSVSVPARFLNTGTLRAMFVFSEDLRPPDNLQINRLEHPVLCTYYERGWQQFNE